MSRRAADEYIQRGRVLVNGHVEGAGYQVKPEDTVTIDGEALSAPKKIKTTIAFHKPRGLVCSRDGQGAETIYDALPKKYSSLDYVGRLDKDSTGLLLLTSDGELNQLLSHPRYEHEKKYLVLLNSPLSKRDHETITTTGVTLLEGHVSSFVLYPAGARTSQSMFKSGLVEWIAVLKEGKNRQIRRTFAKLGYSVKALHRTRFGPFTLSKISSGQAVEIPEDVIRRFINSKKHDIIINTHE